MKALDRKLLRDLRHHWAQVLSIAGVVACGVMAVVAMRSTLSSLRTARDDYYAHHRFADVFATLERAPAGVVAQAAALPGVGAVEGRVTKGVTMSVPGLDGVATGLIVSVPEHQRPMLNALYLRRGRWVAPGREDEVIASERFATLDAIGPGDSLGVVVNGRWRRLHVVGIATSPEFIYEMAGGGFMVDNRRFGILWMGHEAAAAAAGMEGAVNDLALSLAPGADERDVIARLDRLLAPWGGRGAVGRQDQLSANVISDEMRQLEAIGRIFPLFFLGTAAFLLNVVLTRLVATQRDEIAALKAFGYSDREVGVHYLQFALAAVLLGALLGIASGLWLGNAYTGLYRDVFRFPVLAHHTSWTTAAVAIGISGGSALVGALVAVRQAVRLPPAEALRPPSPTHYHPLLLERLGVVRHVPPAAAMILRNIERRPARALLSVVGIALAGALLVAGMFPWDSAQHMIGTTFDVAQREDLGVTFTMARPARAARELSHVPGVRVVQPFRIVPVRLRNGAIVRSVGITGLDTAATLHRIVDDRVGVHDVPPTGAVMTASLARVLGVRAGDTLRVELVERGNVPRALVLAATIEEMIGTQLYMDRGALNRLVGEGDVVSGAWLAVEPGRELAVARRLERTPLVAGVTSRRAMLDYFDETMADSILVTTTIVVIAAAVIALGVVYNGARIALSERGRELASLRVLGFTRGEVGTMLLGEQGVITLLGVPLGFGVGLGFAAMLARSFAAERHRFPLVVESSTYAFSAAVVGVAALLAALVVRRRINHLDLVAVLKTRE